MNAERPAATTSSSSPQRSPHLSPPGPSQLRHRPLGRSSTLADVSSPLSRRRSSIFSDSFSEARRSIRSSTDELLLPKVKPADAPGLSIHDDSSHLHSAPLALALLPAVGGLLFTNGSAFVTDLTILAIGAVLLNWCVKLPWYALYLAFLLVLLPANEARDWYRAAQAVRVKDVEGERDGAPNLVEVSEDEGQEEAQEEALASSREMSPPPPRSQAQSPSRRRASEYESASQELRLHEISAFALCFLGPVIGAILLHAIRDQLSRPREGLVSNYNLTIFLLASELRPTVHAIKMIQARTLYLQRIVASNAVAEETKADASKLLDLNKRLEELEAHVAESVDNAQKQAALGDSSAKTAAQVTYDVRKGFQPELDALNRAVRRYEKRTTVASIQVDGRLYELEARVKDAISLAASAQRNAQNQQPNYATTLLNWICALVVVPAQSLLYLSNLPARAASWGLTTMKTLLGLNRRRPSKYSSQSRSFASKGQGRGTKKIA